MMGLHTKLTITGVATPKDRQIQAISKQARQIYLMQYSSLVLTVISVLMLCFGVAVFFINFHNLDQSHDLTVLLLQLGKNPDEYLLCYDNGDCDSFFNSYMNGLNGMKMSIPIIIISSMGVIISLVCVVRAFSYRKKSGRNQT